MSACGFRMRLGASSSRRTRNDRDGRDAGAVTRGWRLCDPVLQCVIVRSFATTARVCSTAHPSASSILRCRLIFDLFFFRPKHVKVSFLQTTRASVSTIREMKRGRDVYVTLLPFSSRDEFVPIPWNGQKIAHYMNQIYRVLPISRIGPLEILEIFPYTEYCFYNTDFINIRETGFTQLILLLVGVLN